MKDEEIIKKIEALTLVIDTLTRAGQQEKRDEVVDKLISLVKIL